MKPLTATARLQFHRDFPLAAGTALVPYLARLGVSHLYASPLLKARAGSTHGYDIVDHNRINPELGGEEALAELVAALRAHGMGLILDIVPNHMGVGGDDNAWWLDVLEWGRASPYAEFFDIDYDPPDASMRGRLLAPFLGAPYGECLAKGEIRLRFDPHDGRLFAAYYHHRFPINPRDYASVLLTGGGVLEGPARAFADLGPGGQEDVREAARAARYELVLPEYRHAVEEVLRAYDPQSQAGQERLHRLLERQAFRLSWWRAATDEINWRRFFDVNGLAGVRVEVPEVFEATHRTVLRLYREGLIDGVRIDHVDGLANPRDYCRKLRRRLEALRPLRPTELQGEAPVLWVEKILFAHERLDGGWMTDGTTGYDFMNEVGALLHDPAGEQPLTRIWTELTGQPGQFEEEAKAARRQIVTGNLSSELNGVATALHRVVRRDLSTRDYTLTGIRNVLIELLVHFHTYRIYAGAGGLNRADAQAMDWALAGARRSVRMADRDLLDLVARLVSGEGLRALPPGTRRNEWLRAMVKFQQLSAPTAAKSVEDTAFYRYGRLISRNEVGSEPSQFALSPAGMHAASRERLRRLPRALLATATHDHKRGEDGRARLAVLSEVPGEWESAVQRWIRLNAPLRRHLPEGDAPAAADELMLYQTIVSAWPLGLSDQDGPGIEAYRGRLAGWLEKALREAKRRTGWTVPNEEYEQACAAFLAGCLDPARPVGAEMAAFARRIAPAGAVNALTQTVLRLTSPGVPDLYQGTEFWDFSLVDPDNRRPVDWPGREAALAALAGADAPSLETLLGHWTDGRVKQAVIARLLALRARAPQLFAQGAYRPLRIEGARSDHILAFARMHEEQAVIVAVPRLPWAMGAQEGAAMISPAEWGATSITLPRSLVAREAASVLGGFAPVLLTDRLQARDLFAHVPVAVLEVA